MPEATPLRVVLYSPDRARPYDGRTRERDGVGGGITARLSMVEALAALGHDVTAYVHCDAPLTHGGVRYVPLDACAGIDCDVFIAISTGGALTFAPLRALAVRASLRIVWVQGAPKPADLDAAAADCVYVASNFLRDVCATRWGVPERRIFVCYNGIHQEYFRPIEASPPRRDPFAIAYVGPPEKGLDACIQVLRRLRAQDDRFHLDVFGGAPLWGRPADPPPDEPGLRFRGLLGQRQLAAELFGCEYCLALQAMEEGFGIAVQEAKRAGAIVIASLVGAFRETVRHGMDGYLIAGAHDTAAVQEEVASLILSLADDPSRRARIRRRALATPWDWNLAARTWTAHWRQALAGGQRPGGADDATQAGVLDLPDGRHVLATGAYCPAADVYPLSPVRVRFGGDAPRRVVIAGDYGHGNLGDEAILSVLLDRFQQASPDLEPIVASGDPTATARRHDVEAVGDRDLPALRDAAARSELIALGGGGLFHDHYGVDEATLMTDRHWGLTYCAAWPGLAESSGAPLLIFAAGAGPLSSEAGRRLTRIVFDRAAACTVRDAESRDLIEAIGARAGRVEVTADPAFLLEAADPGTARRRLRGLGVPDDRPFVAVALRHWDRGAGASDREAAVAGALDRLIARHGVVPLFVPFQSGGREPDRDDGAVARRVRALMRQSDAAIMGDPDMSPPLVQAIFNACDAVVAMRLHAVILAANARVPFVALRYDDKLAHAARRLGLGQYVVDLATITPDGLFDRIEAARAARDEIRARIDSRLPALRDGAARNFMVAADLLTRRRSAGREGPASIGKLPSAASAAKRLARAALPAPWRRFLRENWQRRLMSREAFVFDRYKRARIRQYGSSLDGLPAPGEPGLVSVVLPAHNGAALIREAIDSVLGQSFARLELIIVNDGSTDDTGAIADEYARRDPRVRVVHQSNQKLPAALSRGFRLARGEFHTWTSCDNRLKPGALQQLVDCLRRHPGWDVVYANVDLIGEDGRPLRDSPHYASYQVPHGGNRVRLPGAPTDLNTRANNFVGAGFLYRSRVTWLLGDYDRFRFGLEDYDYWMRVNALMTLRHADFDEPVADYRFHGASLTARADALGLPAARERLMVFEQFRRDYYLSPMVWVFEDPASEPARALAQRARQAGHVVRDAAAWPDDGSASWTPVLRVRAPGEPPGPEPRPASDAFAVLQVSTVSDAGRPFGAGGQAAPEAARSHQVSATDVDQLFRAIDIRAKTEGLAAIERLAEAPPAAELAASIIICTRRASTRLDATIAAALAQDFPAERFEVIVVNNDPSDSSLAAALGRRRPDIRIADCPVPGVSAARNAGLANARGECVCFLDDDALAGPEWLARICQAFDAHPEAGVVGGPVLLDVPEPRPATLARGWEGYWSHFDPGVTEYTEVTSCRDLPWGANWAARRSVLAAVGGFRTAFGRTDTDFSGGEELVAAALAQRLGWRVAIVPGAIVRHRVDPDRFTYEHVRQTMLARHLVAYATGRELLMPGTPGIGSTLARLAFHHVDFRLRSWRHVFREVRYRKAAQFRVLQAQVRDLKDRRRTPAVEEP